MVDPTQTDATPGDQRQIPTLADAIGSYLGSQDSGIYRTNAKHILESFRDWAVPQSYRRVDHLDKHVLTDFAEQLRIATENPSESELAIGTRGAIAPSTAGNYYDVVAGWLSYCLRRDWLDTNPAHKEAPKQELPAESDDPTSEQRWTKRNRVNIVRWSDWRAEDAIEHEWMDPAVAVRDRALVALLGYSGARGAELLADPRDDNRDGLRWADVDLTAGTMKVWAKRGKNEHVGIHEKPLRYLRLHKRRQAPASDAWPVFVTRHAHSLAKGLPDGVDASGDYLDTYRDVEATPPSLSTDGGRTIVKRLSLESGIRGTDDEVLKPHAARRGLGHELYRQDPEKSQEVLRHQDISTTHKHYTDVGAADQKRDLDELID